MCVCACVCVCVCVCVCLMGWEVGRLAVVCLVWLDFFGMKCVIKNHEHLLYGVAI